MCLSHRMSLMNDSVVSEETYVRSDDISTGG